MARQPRYTVVQVAEALEQSAGIRSSAAAKLGCTLTTVSNYIERHKSLQDLEAEIVERHLDMAESKLLKAIQEGNLGAIIFYLKTKGKHRGYSERYQVEGPDGGPVQIEAKVDFSNISAAGLDAAQQIMDWLREADGHAA